MEVLFFRPCAVDGGSWVIRIFSHEYRQEHRYMNVRILMV